MEANLRHSRTLRKVSLIIIAVAAVVVAAFVLLAKGTAGGQTVRPIWNFSNARNPVSFEWLSDTRLLCISERKGIFNVFAVDLTTGSSSDLTFPTQALTDLA